MPRRDRSVGTELATVAFLALVRFRVDFVAVPVWKIAVAALALDGNVGCVKLLNVNAQICFASTSRWTQFTLEHGLLAHRVYHFVSLQRVGLGEASVADITWKREKF